MHHKVKILPVYFKAVADGRKTYEVRKNDRNYEEGDAITLQEWDSELGYSGCEMTFCVGYVVPLDKFYGPQNDMVCFSLLDAKDADF